MWPKPMASRFLRKNMGSNNFVADLPPDYSDLEPPVKQSTDQGTLKIFVSSWNVGGIRPPADIDMEDWLNIHENPADIYVFGFQEIVPLNASNVLARENSKASVEWNRILRAALEKPRTRTQMRQDFRRVISKQMVGIFITVWVRSDLYGHIKHPSVSCVGCGLMGRFGNKGSVSVRFLLHETSFCFVCSHLASGGREGDERHRNSDAEDILLRSSFPPVLGPLRNLPTKILDHDRVIWFGDLNYRIHLPDATTRSLVDQRNWSLLLQKDQLKAELKEGRVFQGWREGDINFPPTYKYYLNSEIYYGGDVEDGRNKSKRFRAPAWCDRIIWYGEGLKQSQYNRGESRLSDHRPVKAVFSAEVEQYRASSGLKRFFSGNDGCFRSSTRGTER
ncbi:hypothetical protein SAY86_016219 [Trapa natans]|uniref:Inositol polyphosphate-related phosphatase domain-containing protein n=1 Tax=Trapa natans TaxID=22666 RepID=A0AAN7QWY9_TRANT|nr:hypothetical protein SAY86_016219 [Trapa natans]